MIQPHSGPEATVSEHTAPPPDNDQRERLQQLQQLLQKDDPTDAVYACDAYNRDYPLSGAGWSIASHIALRINDPAAAYNAIERALRLEPARTEWLLQKVHCLDLLGLRDDARPVAAELAKRLYPSAGVSTSVGLLLSSLNMYEEAEALFADAVKQEPAVAGYHYNLATVQRFLGRIDAAEASLEKAIALDPDDVDAHALRSGLRVQTPGSNHLESLRETLRRTGENPRSAVSVCYTLAKELEDLGRHAESFEYLRQGATTRRAHLRYDVRRDTDTMTKIREVFDESLFAAGADGFIDASPTFVIGLPRTGTTLVERILGSHSVVRPAGELNNFAVQLVSIIQAFAGRQQLSRGDLVAFSGKIDFATLGQAYVESTRPYAAGHVQFVDKMPMNFLYAGLIHLALPKARIIHVERQPMDTCYAIFKTLFQNAYPFSYDLEELGRYFVGYHELMAHWHRMMPGVMHRVRYEDLVTDTRTVTESLLDFCGLSWEEQCLRFHEAGGHSTTASAAQVRSPIHSGSIGRWRMYEKELAPIADILRQANIDIDREREQP